MTTATRPRPALNAGSSRYTATAVSWNSAAFSPAEAPAASFLKAFQTTG